MLLRASSHLFAHLTPLQRSTISAFFGFFAYGIWAYWVNVMHGAGVALKAACVQGGYSFALTFVMTMMIETVYHFFCNSFGASRLSQIATVSLICGILYASSWWLNVLAGTPEIFETVILGYIIGTIYTTTYVLGLKGRRAI